MKSKLFPTGVATDLKVTPQASASLDFVRSMAALLVMAGHLRALFFVTYDQVAHPNIIVKGLYFLTSFGHQAVMVFFVLSGFFITISVIRMHSRNTWSWKEYLLQRLSRLWAVLIPALFLTLFWDKLGIHVFHFNNIYAPMPSDQFVLQAGTPVDNKLGIANFVGNFFFLQGIAVSTYGSNGPLWSLSCEFWYYIAFPCVFIAAMAGSWPRRIVHILAFILIGILVGKAISLSFGIWLLGFAVLFVPHLWKSHKPVNALWIFVALIPFALSLAMSVVRKSIPMDYPVAICFTLALYFILRSPNAKGGDADSSTERNGVLRRDYFQICSRYTAGFSYSLYLLHLPPLVFIHAYLYNLNPIKWQPTMPNILRGATIACVVIMYAWGVSLLTEKKTQSFKSLLRRGIGTLSKRTA